ncbi:MAG: c-type cytochrome [Myxococcota bacterium]
MGRLPVALAVVLGLLACTDDAPPPPPGAGAATPADGPPAGLDDVTWGERLFQQYGCIGCHTIHGTRLVGGPLDGLWGTERPLADGTTVRVDADYVRESILRPDAKIAEGYEPRMTPYEGLLGDAQVDALVAYIASLR